MSMAMKSALSASACQSGQCQIRRWTEKSRIVVITIVPITAMP